MRTYTQRRQKSSNSIIFPRTSLRCTNVGAASVRGKSNLADVSYTPYP